MAAVAHAHGLGVGGQRQLVAGARVAEDVAAVAAVVLQERGEAVWRAVPCSPARTPTLFLAFARDFQIPPPDPCVSLEGVLADLRFSGPVPLRSAGWWRGARFYERGPPSDRVHPS